MPAIGDGVDSYEISRGLRARGVHNRTGDVTLCGPGANEAVRGRRPLGIGHLHGSVVDSASALDLGGVPCQFRRYEQSSCD